MPHIGSIIPIGARRRTWRFLVSATVQVFMATILIWRFGSGARWIPIQVL